MKEKTLFRLALATTIMGIIFLFILSQNNSIKQGPFTVTKVVDGDTIDLDNGDRIRFSGIDTPEIGTCYSNQAKEALTYLVLGKEIYLESDQTQEGKYGRTLGYVYVDQNNVNAILVENGYAKVFDKYNETTNRYEELKILEAKAKDQKKGVWNCPKQDCLYVANKETKVYHKPECRWAKKLKEENKVCITTEDQLKEYTPAKSC
jgi:micrococcal nuclease